jgi:kumamolisin
MLTRNAKSILLSTAASLGALLLTVDTGAAQVTLPSGATLPNGSVVLNPNSAGPWIVSPPSGQARPGEAQTSVLGLYPREALPQVTPNIVGPPETGWLIETPASLACIYQLGVGGADAGKGCDPNLVTAVVPSSSGSKAIAIVEAFDYGTAAAAADVLHFDNQFGVGPLNLSVVYGTNNPAAGCVNGPAPASAAGTGWDVEEAIEMEMAHAMAPSAHIYLVEAASASLASLLNAEQVAAACVTAAGGGMVVNGWGVQEFSIEANSDMYFNAANVVYFAAAGNIAGSLPSTTVATAVRYPCASPNVICVGGTTISRDQTPGDPNIGHFESEVTWNWSLFGGTGGGLSAYEPRPAYQNFMSSIVGSSRGVPDLAAVADTFTGVWIYNNSSCTGWCVQGGTAVSTALVGGIFNFANFFYASSNDAVNNIYTIGQSGVLAPFVTHINSGVCGAGGSNFATNGQTTYPNATGEGNDPANTFATTGIAWNTCTGWGTPKDAGNPNFMRARR